MLPFVDRLPTAQEVEKLRLLLSTYQDGSGGIKVNRKNKSISSFPDYRDFERCVAIAFGGRATENKGVFDVILRNDENNIEYGISCKMKGDDAWRKLTGSSVDHAYIHMELANASGDFRNALAKENITLDNYTDGNNPLVAGRAIINLVKSWHDREDFSGEGSIDLKRSCFLVMVYDTSSTRCSLFQLPLALPDPCSLNWYCPTKKSAGKVVPCKRIQGDFSGVKIFDYYATSGGQLKYYYPLSWPIPWSASFELENIPKHILLKDPVSTKAEIYFEEAWQKCSTSALI